MGCKDSKASKPTSKHGSNQSGLISREFTIDLIAGNNNTTPAVDNSTAPAVDNSTAPAVDISKLTGKQRIIRELKYFQENAPSNMRLADSFDGSNLNKWIVDVDGAKGTIYKEEKFKLQFVFKDNYPAKAPTITFVPGHVPQHPHIYSNGHMCLEILYGGYRSEMTLVYICNCIMLMLDCNKKKEWPYNDSWYNRMGISDPNHGMWAWEEYY